MSRLPGVSDFVSGRGGGGGEGGLEIVRDETQGTFAFPRKHQTGTGFMAPIRATPGALSGMKTAHRPKPSDVRGMVFCQSLNPPMRKTFESDPPTLHHKMEVGRRWVPKMKPW